MESACLLDELVYINVARFFLRALVYMSPIFIAASENTCVAPVTRTRARACIPGSRCACGPPLFASGIRIQPAQLVQRRSPMPRTMVRELSRTVLSFFPNALICGGKGKGGLENSDGVHDKFTVSSGAGDLFSVIKWPDQMPLLFRH